MTPKFLTSVLGSNGPTLKSDEASWRPYVTLTFAQSIDAKIAGRDGQQLILSGRESMIMTHWCVELRIQQSGRFLY
jgi:2,5-diamino-6-(ribosylamino)-4(3H)-pyrimidinone 5'-phosphate reductase